MANKERTSPKLRFPGFTEPWEQRKLGDEFVRANERNDGSFGINHWISVAKMYFQDPEKVTSNNLDTRTYVMRVGDIAFEGHPNAEFEFGRFVANDIGDGIISELFPIYRHKNEYYNPYWKYAIQIERVMRPVFAKAITSSGASSNKLNEEHFLRESILIPSLAEQVKIGDYFASLDNLITLHRRKCDALRRLKAAMLQKMFPRNGETEPELRFPGFTDPWEQRKLGEVVNIYDGVHQTPEYKSAGVMFLSVENISTLKSEKFISQEAFERDYKIYPQYGDILMTRIGDVGTTNVVETTEKMAFYVSLALLKPQGIDSYFLSNAMKTMPFQKGLRERTLVTAIPQKINKDEIGKVVIFITNNVGEQKQIGDYFKSLDTLITLHQRKCDALKKLKQAMLQQMFV